MLKGLVFVITFIALSAVAQPEASPPQPKEPNAASKANTSDTLTSDPANPSISSSSTPPPEEIHTTGIIGIELKAKNTEPDKIDTAEKDLIEQKRMADATEQMSSTAIYQLWISIIGSALTLAAVIATVIAAKAAQSSALSAEQSVKVSQDIGEKQVRAYLSVSSVEVRITKDDQNQVWVSTSCTLCNYGQSPAKRIEIPLTASVNGYRLSERIEVQHIGVNSEIKLSQSPHLVYEGDLSNMWNVNSPSVAHFASAVFALDIFDKEVTELFVWDGQMETPDASTIVISATSYRGGQNSAWPVMLDHLRARTGFYKPIPDNTAT